MSSSSFYWRAQPCLLILPPNPFVSCHTSVSSNVYYVNPLMSRDTPPVLHLCIYGAVSPVVYGTGVVAFAHLLTHLYSEALPRCQERKHTGAFGVAVDGSEPCITDQGYGRRNICKRVV